MGDFKIIKLILVIIFNIFCVSAQKSIAFFGAGKNFNTSFDNSGYFNISTGVQYNIETCVKPEVELRFFFGAL